MNKLIVFAVAIFATVNVSAQTSQELNDSKARSIKMDKLVDTPKS